MIIKVAWRNVWRNWTRSIVVMMAVSLGLWAGIFLAAFMNGVSEQRLKGVVESQTSHLQIHHPEFEENFDVEMLLEDGQEIVSDLKKDEKLAWVSGRIVVQGMINSSRSSGRVMIKGIVPEDEQHVSNISQKVAEGSYFETQGRNPILIGQKLAGNLNVKLNSKVILTFQDTTRNITSGAFRVCGIYKTNSATFDAVTVYVRKRDIGSKKLLNLGSGLHEIAIILKQDENIDAVKVELAVMLPGKKVDTWKDIIPELYYLDEIMDVYLLIFMGIILLAMAFGIINTMLMAVLERIRELGMLMAVGMNKRKIFAMIVWEAVFLTLAGTPIGLLLGFISVGYFNENGFDLSLFAEGLNNFDLDSVLYPSLDYRFYPKLVLMVVFTSIASSIYPAVKALSLKPADAIRSI